MLTNVARKFAKIRQFGTTCCAGRKPGQESSLAIRIEFRVARPQPGQESHNRRIGRRVCGANTGPIRSASHLPPTCRSRPHERVRSNFPCRPSLVRLAPMSPIFRPVYATCTSRPMIKFGRLCRPQSDRSGPSLAKNGEIWARGRRCLARLGITQKVLLEAALDQCGRHFEVSGRSWCSRHPPRARVTEIVCSSVDSR